MVNRQVITIAPDGRMQGLQIKPGQGLDLRQFGESEIERVSLVKWDSNSQAWFVDILQPLGSGILTLGKIRDCEDCKSLRLLNHAADGEAVALFAEYDDAVQAEILYLNNLRESCGGFNELL